MNLKAYLLPSQHIQIVYMELLREAQRLSNRRWVIVTSAEFEYNNNKMHLNYDKLRLLSLLHD